MQVSDSGTDFKETLSVGAFGSVVSMRSSAAGQLLSKHDLAYTDDPQYDADGEYGHVEEHKKMGWVSIGMVLIGDVVGMGVLTIGVAFKQLGWVLGPLLLAAMLPINIYMGILLSKSRQMITAGLSYEQMAKFTVARRWFTNFVIACFYVYLTVTLGGYILALVQSFKMIFYEWSICGPLAGLLVVAGMTIPTQLRTLSDAKILMWINFFLINFAVFGSLFYMIANMSAHIEEYHPTTYIIPNDLTLETFFNGFSKLLFSYLGCYIYLEIMSEMKQPNDFPKAFYVAAPYQLGVYMFVGVTAYVYDGSNAADMIVKQVNPKDQPVLFRMIAISLFLHLIVSYLIKATILCRKFHVLISPSTVNSHSKKAKLYWFGITSSLLMTCYVIANVIPFFDKITSILGGLLAPMLGYILPVIFFVGARYRVNIPISMVEKVIFGILLAIMFVMMILGTVYNIISLLNKMKATGVTPFQCIPMSYYDQINPVQ